MFDHLINIINLKFYVILHHCFSILKVFDNFLIQSVWKLCYSMILYILIRMIATHSKHTSSEVLHGLIKALLQIM